MTAPDSQRPATAREDLIVSALMAWNEREYRSVKFAALGAVAAGSLTPEEFEEVAKAVATSRSGEYRQRLGDWDALDRTDNDGGDRETAPAVSIEWSPSDALKRIPRQPGPREYDARERQLPNRDRDELPE